MPTVVQFSAPHRVELVECEAVPLRPGSLRVRTWYSGISAGTELTAYRGSNPYLTKTWDAERRLFVEGAPTFDYPVQGWGYSEAGEVVEVAGDVAGLAPGDLVAGIWGHCSEAVVDADMPSLRRLPEGTEPLHGTFARVGAIALNGVLAADARLGETVAVFGQGVIGLLATQLATLSGARVLAVDALDNRLLLSTELGAERAVPALVDGGAGAAIRELTDGQGADSAVELSGSHQALHEAVRSVVVDGTVAAAGFYQGDGVGLRLGEEFHHNRVRLVASQIGGTPTALGARWNQSRLVSTVLGLISDGRLRIDPLVSHVVEADRVAEAFEMLDERPGETLQVVLRFPGAR